MTSNRNESVHRTSPHLTKVPTDLPTRKEIRSALYRDAIRAALLGMAVNIGLGIVKLAGGVIGASFALISDAVNSIGDSLTSLVVVIALVIAQRPADREHPYGHTRAEAIAATNIALLIVLTALYVGWEAITRIRMPHELPPTWTLGIAAANVVIKESLYRYKVRVGKRTESSAIIANAWDHRSDAMASLAVLIGLGVIRWGGPTLIWADELAAMVVVTLIVWNAVRVFRASANELLDVQASDTFTQQIRSTAEHVDGVTKVESLRVRKSGLEYFVDIHIEVNSRLTVFEGHRIGHLVKDHVMDEFPQVRDVLVHLEPDHHLQLDGSL